MNKGMTSPIGNPNPIRRDWPLWKRFDKNIIGGNMVLNHDFKEFIELLNNNQVRYLVVGGYAVALHGHPRYTKDLDVWIDCTPENAERIVTALAEFGFGSLGLTVDDFLEAGQIVQLGYPPSRIDILLSLKGVEFEACYARKVVENGGETAVYFIDLSGLIANKKAVGRYQDLADVALLEG
jgi:hypothetical protein